MDTSIQVNGRLQFEAGPLIVPFDMHKLGKTTPRNRRALHECEQVDCFGDQLRLCGHAGFFDEAEKAEKAAEALLACSVVSRPDVRCSRPSATRAPPCREPHR